MLLSKPIRTDDDTDQNFKFIALPDHARKVVILNMGVVQMFLISRCSSKMKRLLKKYISQIRFTLQIEIDVSIIFIVKADNVELGSFRVESSKRKCSYTDATLFVNENFDELSTFWNDVFYGASRVYKKLLDRFPCQRRTYRFPYKLGCFDIQRLIEWRNTLKSKRTAIKKQHSYVIKSKEQLRSLLISLHSKRYFRTVDIVMKGKRFLVYHAEWVTLDHLFKFDSVVLYLVNVRLTDAEVNAFLKAYIKNETNQSLEHMCLGFKRNLDIHSVLDGLVWSYVKAINARKIGKYKIQSEARNENFVRIVMKNNEICYVNIEHWDVGLSTICICNFKDEVFLPFKLMKLLFLALEQVIKNMSLIEIFNLSLCFTRLRYSLKNILKNQEIKLQIQFDICIQFRLVSPNGTFVFIQVWEYPKDLKKLNGCMRMKIGKVSKVQFHINEPEPNHLVTYWRDIIKGTTEFCSVILDLFNIRFEKLSVKTEKIPIDYGSVVDWINQSNLTFEKAIFTKGTIDDTFYSQTIQNKNFLQCEIQQKPSENFKSPEFRFTNAHVNWKVFNAHWITLENLSDIGSVCLRLFDVKITDQEVNSLFRTLLTGKFQNLELLTFETNGRVIDLAVTFDGIADVERNWNERNWDNRDFDRYGYNIFMRGSTDI
ncbi:hypothetical protein CAEBREN_19086 [Caenorhabditis brenneri]|uniref:Sdz-33 F-box domain-containing protein n=1 Tax=Caenorhabditis brenneri TaxID=135651 RepID=G0NVR5_CAEBE|nr:hypothetical protein CAEBREN_19086 [Caenorhabditis brenneri]